jgi:hypothetical protein
MPAPGQRAKLVNVLDNQMSDDLVPLYRVEIQVGKSPKQGVKCGAIVVFKLNSVDLDFKKSLDPSKYDPEKAARVQQEIQDEINKQTETMHVDPIYFKETEGRWLPWALDKALELYDRFGGNASIKLKCPKLKISVTRSAKDVARLRSTPRELFPVIQDIDQLLEKGYTYDPWGKVIRRGRISAEMGKR